MRAVLIRTVFWLAVVLFPAPLLVTYDTLAREPDSLKTTIALGMTAYSWWLLAVLLSLRPPWLERVVGLPAIYGVHGLLGVLAVVLAYIHRGNLYAGNALAVLLGDWGFWIAVGVLCWSVFFMSGWLVDRVAVLLRTKRFLEPAVRHQVSLWVHRLNLGVITMIWLHAHLLVRVNQYFGFMVLFDLYTVVVLGLYAWKKWIAPDTYAAGTVIANDALGATARRITIRLDRPATALTPGGFFFVRVEGSAVVGGEWHPFSVTDDDQQTVTFTVRQTGDYTGALRGLGTGSRARLEGPFGRFGAAIERHEADRPLVLIGMGAGVAPLMSLIAAHHRTRRIHLLWSVRSAEDAYYRDLLTQQAEASTGKLDVSIRVGRFRRADLEAHLPEDAVSHGAFVVVGPNPGVLSYQRLLRRLGVAGRRVHQERLTM